MVDRVADVRDALLAHDYLADDGLATAIFLALSLQRPLLDALEEEGPVVLLIDEIDRADDEFEAFLLEFLSDFAVTIPELGTVEARGEDVEDELFSERFLVRRALLKAIAHSEEAPPPVLLIDEVDRADDEFEAFLLEILSDYAVTVPELGTFRAETPPVVIITSNRTRDVHDALKRRCLYHWVEHPDFEREVAIVRLRAPGVASELARQVAGAVEHLRTMDLYKPPGVAETIDWAQALAALGRTELDETLVDVTLGTILKYREDQERARGSGLDALVRAAVARGA